MPKVIIAGDGETGVAMTYEPSTRRLYVDWYVRGGDRSHEFQDVFRVWPLEALCKELGITHKDLEYVAKRLKADALAELVRKS